MTLDAWLNSLISTQVVGGEHERVDACTHFATPFQRFRVGDGLDVEVIPSPCHTKGHVMFGVLGDDGEAVDALFTGDTLFCGGCGAPFEGTLAGVARNFRRIWHRCGDRTLLFPGHEYSEQLLLEYFGGSQPTPWNPRQFAVLTAALQRARLPVPRPADDPRPPRERGPVQHALRLPPRLRERRPGRLPRLLSRGQRARGERRPGQEEKTLFQTAPLSVVFFH